MCCAAAAPVAAQRFDNAAVIALRHAGLGEAAITAKVKSMPCGYDVSTPALIALTRAGLPDAVIAAMVERCAGSPLARGTDTGATDPAALHAPGIYVVRGAGDAGRMELLRPGKTSGIKISGNGSILMPYVGKLILPGMHSNLSVPGPAPAFFFYFATRDRAAAAFGTPESVAAQSPDEFSLVRLKVQHDQREANIGKVTMYSGRGGVDTKATIRYRSVEFGEGAFRIEFAAPLEPGEYAFVLTGANSAARVYDFSVE